MKTSPSNKAELAQEASAHVQDFLHHHLDRLSKRMNIQTFRKLLLFAESMIRMEADKHALWMSHIATEVYGGDREPAGVKCFNRVLSNPHWSAYDIHRSLRDQGEEQATQIAKEVYIALDPSDWEKPESLKSEGLQKVVSPRARHLARPRRGFGGAPLLHPVCVPGFHFIAATLMGATGPGSLVDYRWWKKSPTESQQTMTLMEFTHSLAIRYQDMHPIFLGDRGVGNRAILRQWGDGGIRFVVRFNDQVGLCAKQNGELLPAKQFFARKQGTVKCSIYDTRTRTQVTVRLLWCSVWLPDTVEPLTLVVVRHPNRKGSWRLVTNLPVNTSLQAMHIAEIYARRWQVEWSLRFLKSEMQGESPRIQVWERREKLVALAFLVYAYLVSLLITHHPLVQCILQAESHRTGRKTRLVIAPLYRLRAALRRLLTRYIPVPEYACAR